MWTFFLTGFLGPSLFGQTTSPGQHVESGKIDGKGMMSKYGWDMKNMCVRLFFVQPGVVSTCNVIERISFVNRFAAVFRKGVWRLFFFCSKQRSNFEAFPKVCGVVIAGFLNRVWCVIFPRTPRLRFFPFLKVFLTLHISDKRWIPASVVHCGSEAAPFPRTARLN